MDEIPLVSIGVPNYNYAHYIIDTLESVAQQSYPNIELIIVDDCSTDGSIEIIENWMSNYYGTIKISFTKNTKNGGLTKVCNQILETAKGKYFQTLDADDLLLPDKIEKQVKVIEGFKNAAFIYSNIAIIDESGKIIKEDYLGRIQYDKNNMPQGNIFEQLFDFNFIPLPSTLVNTECARNVGGFDETLQVQDYYLWLRLAEKFDVIYIPETTALYREHSSSMSNSSSTNPRSADSVLTIKYRYYKLSSNKIKSIIKKDIYYSSSYLYRKNFPTANKWLKRNLLLNPGVKSLMYYVANSLGIRCSVLDGIKLKLINNG
jgi:glycosyltransferase involved in cell wall biosynthesis